MSLMDHLHHANNAKQAEFKPFVWQKRILGWLHQDRMDQATLWPEIFQVRQDRIELPDHHEGVKERSSALAELTGSLRKAGLITGWRNEMYPLTDDFMKDPVAEIERAACPYLGLRSWGVHMTGYVRKDDGIHIWVATRAKDKPNYPGMLDNTVAGGQPIGLSPLENMIKESEEEADIPPELSKKLKPVGLLRYAHQIGSNLKPDQIYCFDLELPEEFIPVNTDGEVDSFELIPASDVLEIVRTSARFKYNCNLCLIDFFIRHGLISPENEPDYASLNLGLRGIGFGFYQDAESLSFD